ncbi:MAG TPA: hypothetical protein VMY40_15065, partial [Anaerolineae bacterium]|nr:hypothetical protein [Anaerolineae bacterium]
KPRAKRKAASAPLPQVVLDGPEGHLDETSDERTARIDAYRARPDVRAQKAERKHWGKRLLQAATDFDRIMAKLQKPIDKFVERTSMGDAPTKAQTRAVAKAEHAARAAQAALRILYLPDEERQHAARSGQFVTDTLKALQAADYEYQQNVNREKQWGPYGVPVLDTPEDWERANESAAAMRRIREYLDIAKHRARGIAETGLVGFG